MNKKTLVSLIAFALSAGSLTANAASKLIANDELNTLQGLDSTMQYKLSTDNVWKDFVSEKDFQDSVDLKGNVTVTVRDKTKASTSEAEKATYPKFSGSLMLYTPGDQYWPDAYVEYHGTVYIALTNTSTLPGSDDTWLRYTGKTLQQPTKDPVTGEWIFFDPNEEIEDTGKCDFTYPRLTPTQFGEFDGSGIDYFEGMNAGPGMWVNYNGQYYMATEFTTSIPGTTSSWRTVQETLAPGGLNMPDGTGSETETETGSDQCGEIIGEFKFTPWSGEKAAAYQIEQKNAVTAQRKVIGTFSERGIEAALEEGTPYLTPEAVIGSWGDKLTHLNYDDAIIVGGKIIDDDYANGPGMMKRLRANGIMKNVKQLITISGTGEQLFYNAAKSQNAQKFEDVLTSPESVSALAAQMVDFMLKNNFDGINVKWTQTDTDTDRQNFSLLIKDLRAKLDAEGKQHDKYFQLAATVSGDYRNIQYLDPAVTAPLLDAINVAAYDMHKPSADNVTGHRAPLYANAQDSDKNLNVDAVMKAFHTTYNVPKNKLILGVDFAGYAWGGVEATQKVSGLPGLLNGGTATVKGPWDDAVTGVKNGYTPYAEIMNVMNRGRHYNRYYDTQAQATYLYSATTKTLYTYEDDESLRKKIDYIQKEGLGGISVANLNGDTHDKAMASVVKSVRYLPAAGVKADDVKGIVVSLLDNNTRLTVNFDRKALNSDYRYNIEADGKYIYSVEGNRSFYSYRANYGNEASISAASVAYILSPGTVVSVKRTKPDAAVVGQLVVTQDMLNGNNPVLNDGSVKSLSVVKKNNVPYVMVDFDTNKLNSTDGSSWVGKIINDDKEKGNYFFNCDNGKCSYGIAKTKEDGITTVEARASTVSVGETIVIERVSPNPATVAKIVVTEDMLK